MGKGNRGSQLKRGKSPDWLSGNTSAFSALQVAASVPVPDEQLGERGLLEALEQLSVLRSQYS